MLYAKIVADLGTVAFAAHQVCLKLFVDYRRMSPRRRRYPLAFDIAIIGMIVARVSLAALFVIVFRWELGGARFAAVLDQSIRSVLIYYRFKTGKWELIAV